MKNVCKIKEVCHQKFAFKYEKLTPQIVTQKFIWPNISGGKVKFIH